MVVMTRKPPRSAPRTGDAENRSDVQGRRDQIGYQLRRLYEDVAREPVPDEFLKLLQDADKDPSAEAE